MRKKIIIVSAVFLIACLAGIAVYIGGEKKQVVIKTRQETIPRDAVKGDPGTDSFPPILQSDDWQPPVPMPGPINTEGAEDSPFIIANGAQFYFFFTPDVRVPAEKQLIDGVTGIWWSNRLGDNWTEPARIILNDDVSLDGAEFIQRNTMWFGSVRVGNYREIDVYTAQYRDDEWKDVTNAGKQLNVDYDIGEFCLSADEKTLYFGRGNASRDIWSIQKNDGSWGNLRKVPNVNSDDLSEDQPFITPDGNELWFTGQSRKGYPGPAIYRSIWNMTEWGAPTEIISSFAGEPVLDSNGNIYFVHHFYSEAGKMIEADIYVSYRK